MTATETVAASGWLSQRNAIRLTFFLHAFANGGLFTRIPDIQVGLGLNEGELGLALLGQPLGAIVTFLIAASATVERIGTKTVLLAAIPALAVGQLLMALAPSHTALFLVFVAYGGLFAVSNVALNVEADRVEAAGDERLMSSCHGVWSLGFLAAALLGALARGIELPAAIHLASILPLVAIGVVAVIGPMRPAPPRAHVRTSKQSRLVLPSIATLALVGFAISGALSEVASRQWSVIYMRDTFTAPAWVDTLTIPTFLVSQAIGRLLADRWVARFGPLRVARVLIAIAFAGTAMMVFAPNLYVALCGSMLVGFGVCASFPLSTSAAAQIGDRPSSENVAAFTLTTQVILLGSPALLGFVAQALDIRATFALILPMLALSILLARFLKPRR